MEFSNLVEERRSIRSYQEGVSVDSETVQKIIACAQNAPSWKNSQTGRYYVVNTAKNVARVRATLSDYNAGNTKNAAAYIVATFVTKRSGFDKDGNPTNECGDQWGAYDLGLQNALLLLKAKDLGYDSLIMGLRDAVALREIFSIPENEQVMSIIGVGVRAVNPEKPKRRELSEILKILPE